MSRQRIWTGIEADFDLADRISGDGMDDTLTGDGNDDEPFGQHRRMRRLGPWPVLGRDIRRRERRSHRGTVIDGVRASG